MYTFFNILSMYSQLLYVEKSATAYSIWIKQIFTYRFGLWTQRRKIVLFIFLPVKNSGIATPNSSRFINQSRVVRSQPTKARAMKTWRAEKFYVPTRLLVGVLR